MCFAFLLHRHLCNLGCCYNVNVLDVAGNAKSEHLIVHIVGPGAGFAEECQLRAIGSGIQNKDEGSKRR